MSSVKTMSSVQSSSVSPRTLEKAEKADRALSAADIVQFACPMYYCIESEGHVYLEIMRLGSLQGEVHVQWCTEDVSGKAGERYIANSGQITFADGEMSKVINVEILVMEDWCPTLEFKVRLSAPLNCYLGLYLQTCSIKVIDDDVFPSNKYRGEILSSKEGVRDVNWSGLFIEYVKMIFHQKGIHRKTLITLLFDQMLNIYIFLKLIMSAYLVNVVFNTHDKTTSGSLLVTGNRAATASIIGLGYILPMFFIHLWDYVKINLDIQGHTQVFLSTCLFRKYLNYSEDSRQYVLPSEMQLGLLGETRDLAVGYTLLLDMVQMMGKLFILIFFVCLKEPSSLWIVTCMPVLMVFFSFLRGSKIAVYRRDKDRRDRELIGIIAQTCDKYLTIRHYFRRSAREEIYRSKADETRRAECPVNLVMSNNLYAAKWMGPIFIGIYIVLNAPHVLSGNLKLGFFLATISILGNMSDLFLDVYSGYQRITEMSEPLNTLSIYFNLATDLREFKNSNEGSLRWMQEARKDVMKRPAPPPEAKMMRTDLIPIILDGLTFKYGEDLVVQKANLTAMQGSMVAITGNHGAGKFTLLKLLGRTMVPDIGSVLIPPHLRVLFVSQEPCVLLDLTLWENLTMGCPNGVDQGLMVAVLQEMGMERVLDALERFKDGPRAAPPSPNLQEEYSSRDVLLGTEEESNSKTDVEKEMQKKKQMAFWFDKLNYSEKAKIHLARAFIMNPEVMVMHRPLYHFDDMVGRKVLSLIKAHHENRGLCMPTATLGRRRPRTVFLTTEAEWQEGAADLIWRLDYRSKTLNEHKPLMVDSGRSKTPLIERPPPYSPNGDQANFSSRIFQSQTGQEAISLPAMSTGRSCWSADMESCWSLDRKSNNGQVRHDNGLSSFR